MKGTHKGSNSLHQPVKPMRSRHSPFLGLELTEKLLKLNPDKYAKFSYSDTKGRGLYKQGKLKEALELLENNWDIRPIYNHEIFLHLEEAKKVVASQKNN
jgi:hypothetical protein